ncbi:MAG: PleD family two-component system response regulator [Rickettsiales endosymbiont of Dermacentor nuttalli]
MSATILVVDDLLPNIKLLETKLNQEYYDVVTARSGFEAIKLAKENPIDIILLDSTMPDMDGFETCKQLKSDPKITHIPIVMITAVNELEMRVRGLEAGADDFLTKPINDTALFARIKSLVRIKIMLDELRLRGQTGINLGLLNNPNSNSLMDISGARILIVDDDIAQAEHIASKLAPIANNYIDIISDPAPAFNKILETQCDLVIISTQLSNFDGLRLCSHIRSQEQTRHLPILILVSKTDNKILIKGLDMGVNDYLVTPVEGNELLARVITQLRRKKYQDALKFNYQKSLNMALTDGLTGLYNRRYFDAYCTTLLEEMRSTNKPLVVLIVDIDLFKAVNDTYGHIAGDEVLKQLAECILQNVRVTDLVARYGGEEFVIMMPNITLNDGQDVAERIRKTVASHDFHISTNNKPLSKTISIGITLMNSNDNPETIFNRADKGLYKAKEAGRNQVVVMS